MKSKHMIIAVALALISTLVIAGSNKGNRSHNGLELDSFPVYDLNDGQKSSLIFMWQEEKVARDVYLTLNKLYDVRIFSNIAVAEQRHMDSIKILLTRYSIPISDFSDVIGEFKDDIFIDLYNELVGQGEKSLADAIQVGIDVEELDIKDLEERIPHSTEDIAMVYENLLKASYKHLRAFNRWK